MTKLGSRIDLAIEIKQSEIKGSRGLKTKIAEKLWPGIPSNNAYVRISKMIKEVKMIRPEHVVIICDETGVDPNFLFGKPSKHDKKVLNLNK